MTGLALVYALWVVPQKSADEVADWSLRKRRLEAGDRLEVHLVNLSTHWIEPATKPRLWRVVNDDGEVVEEKDWKPNDLPLRPSESRGWLLDAAKTRPGAYRLEHAPMVVVSDQTRRRSENRLKQAELSSSLNGVLVRPSREYPDAPPHGVPSGNPRDRDPRAP